MKYVFLALYAAAIVLHLIACYPPEKHPLRMVTKCLLMPLLAACYYFTADEFSGLVLAGVLCGFWGDVFLLVPEKSWTFICGLFSFAVGHVFYTVYLAGQLNPAAFPPLWQVVPLAGLYLAGVFMMFKTLWPRLPKKMFAPCLLYMLDISVMSLFAFLFWYTRGGIACLLAFVGSLFFIASDSVLSIVTFKRRIPYRYFIVMGTYIIAQTLLVFSFSYRGI